MKKLSLFECCDKFNVNFKISSNSYLGKTLTLLQWFLASKRLMSLCKTLEGLELILIECKYQGCMYDK